MVVELERLVIMFIMDILIKMEKNIWFGLIRVEAVNGNTDLGDAVGAYVNVAYLAKNKEDFLNTVEESFRTFDFKVLEIEDIERGDNLFLENPETAEKLVLLKQIIDGDSLAWGLFHTYKSI